MTKEDIIEKFQGLNVKQTKGQYSPHKPLLILYAIDKLQHDGKRLIPYSQIDKDLGNLLQEFGSEEMKEGTNYPFWRLRNDKVWEVTDEDLLLPLQNSSKDVDRNILLDHNPSGGFYEDIAGQFQNDDTLPLEIINYLLDKYFSTARHDDILQALAFEFPNLKTLDRIIPSFSPRQENLTDMNNLERSFLKEEENVQSNFAKKWFQTIIQVEQYVGAVYSISYETALVQIHDHYRKKVGGIPSLSFLIATRIKPNEDEKSDETENNGTIDYTLEDSSIILLRVMDAAQLPNSDEAERIRVESAQRVSGEIDKNWDDPTTMDARTNYLLSFAGVKCRVIGTFFLDKDPNNSSRLIKRFGSDLSNYYPNQGLTVYKPNASALKEIVNYQDPDRREDLRNHTRVAIGEVRYASTNRGFQEISNVEVSISPADLLEQKTALFGMTRTGKSNSTKIIAKSVFDLRFDAENSLRIGQIIFDPDGEYANENVQDVNKTKNVSALKNIWESNEKDQEPEVVTYGILKHPNDPKRRLMLLNFYEDENLQNGKEIIDAFLTEDSIYIRNFRQIMFEKPDPEDRSATTRYNRRVLAYRALLAKAGFTPPDNLQPSSKNLFNKELLQYMEKDSKSNRSPNYKSAAKTFRNPTPNWGELHTAFEHLAYFTSDGESGYKEFEDWYVDRSGASGDNWADEDLKKILEMFRRPNGARLIGQARPQHTNTTTEDYAVEIYNHLVKGRLVIIDQSSGEPTVNQSSAKRIMWKIFHENQSEFREGKEPPDILIYIEEAHNLLPSGSDLDTENVWVRTAKEGAKYRLGMVYVTQEVSSIQKNILKNTANWFIGHLNNTDETAELRKFYDFADFEKSILRAQDRGFLRVKTLSNPFVVPGQIKKFEV